MKLSVVIVNYNVKHFLEQCLRSVYAASECCMSNFEGFETDVWVVDNNSTDGSVQMVRKLFPQVNLIANSDNPGFAKANNQALRKIIDSPRQSDNKEFILLLNPDTLVQRDTFQTCIDFNLSNKDCGGLSVKMINGEGLFLKESKRGFPSPATSFYKISGLIKLFPKSRKIAAYYMGHLDDDKTCEVDILPGAFIMMSRDSLEATGLLDESYFMYGEDIDFSWRIKKAGYKNYYLPTTRILHYKGESTRKSSMNYVYTFYNAMAIFARKYFSLSGAKMYNILLQCAIWLRASIDFLKRMVNIMAVPVVDFIVALGGFIAIKQLWATLLAANVNYYPTIYTTLVLPLYVLILLVGSWLAGGYDKPVRVSRIAKGMTVGALGLLVFYSLLDEQLRFSRAVILIGSLWSIASTAAIRGLLSLAHVEGYRLSPGNKRRYLIVGSEEEKTRAIHLFGTTGIEPKETRHCLTCNDIDSKLKGIDEIIFCSKDLSISDILDCEVKYSNAGVDFRILPDNMDVLIGSNYTSSPEELYVPQFGIINNVTNRRSKRIFDIVASLALIILSPLLFWFQKNKKTYFRDCFSVLIGTKTWVGYSQNIQNIDNGTSTPLPALKPSIFRTCDLMPRVKNPDNDRLDNDYANNYRVGTDMNILFINILKI